MFKWDLLLIQLGCKLSVPALLDSYHLCWANQANTGPYFIHRHAHISAKLKTLKKKKAFNYYFRASKTIKCF